MYVLIAKGHDGAVWTATTTMARNLSEGLLTLLPPFWKIAKDYLDGKFKKVKSISLFLTITTDLNLVLSPSFTHEMILFNT